MYYSTLNKKNLSLWCKMKIDFRETKYVLDKLKFMYIIEVWKIQTSALFNQKIKNKHEMTL